MQTRYVAYGMQLQCSFPLPGMTPRVAGELPPLTLCQITPAEMTGAWSGTSDPPAWSGTLGDGCSLTIEQGRAGDLLFNYGDRARFRLDPSSERLDCAPTCAGLGWKRALLCKVLGNVSMMRGYEGLHAAVVESPEGVVAFLGPSGAGKSTLAIEFVRRGWPLFADDVLILASDASGVLAHPATSHLTLAEDGPQDIEAHELGSTLATFCGERWLAVTGMSEDARPVRALFVLARGAGRALQAKRLPANPLLLAPHMLGFQGDAERQRSRFAVYADLMGSAQPMRLAGQLEHRPADLADVVEDALTRAPVLAGSLS